MYLAGFMKKLRSESDGMIQMKGPLLINLSAKALLVHYLTIGKGSV
jgi:hypothetical protein